MTTRKKKPQTRTRYRDAAFLHAIGGKVRAARKARDYSIDRLYLETPNLSRATISRIEKGEADPQISTLKRIAETLGMELWELIKS